MQAAQSICLLPSLGFEYLYMNLIYFIYVFFFFSVRWNPYFILIDIRLSSLTYMRESCDRDLTLRLDRTS
jgi:hypothetical protein